MTATINPTAIAEPVEDENLVAVQAEVSKYRLAAVDAITDTRRLTVVPSGLESPPTRYDRVTLVAQTPTGAIPLRVLEGAHEQLAEKAGVPWKYYDRMLGDAPDLLAANLNYWAQHEPGKRLVRMLKPMSESEASTLQGLGTAYSARAVLSDRYRAIDHGSLVNAILPTLAAHRLSVTEWALTEKHFFLRVKAADETIGEIVPAIFAGMALRPGFKVADIAAEVLGFGASLRNSETGHGAVALDPMFEVKRCLNRIIVDYYSKLRIVHLGGRNEEQEAFYQADTKALDTGAMFLKVRDQLHAFFSGDAKQKAAQVLAAGMGEALPIPEEIGQFAFIDNVAESFDLTEAEQKVLKEEVLGELQFTGRPLTPFAVSQGLTATARRLGSGHMERKDEIERLGWKVLSDPVTALIRAGSGRVRRN